MTPPVGLNLFVACNTAKIKVSEIIPKLMPLLVAGLVILLLCTYFEPLALLLPKLANMRI